MIVAHRGASKRAHENTLESFEQAIALGVDMVELDVRRTGDGALVVFHDPGIKSGGSLSLLSQLTLDQLQKKAAKNKFMIPTLDEAFRVCAGRVKVDIELKENGYAGAIIGRARAHFDPAACIFTSFDPRIIADVKNTDRTLVTGLILAKADSLAWCDVAADVLAPEKRLFSSHRAYFKTARKAGKKIAIWTVDSHALLSRLLVDPLIDAIITNYPDRALALRKKTAQRNR